MVGKLVLLPNLLAEGEEDPFMHLPKKAGDRVQVIQGLIAESEKGGRRYLKKFTFPEGRSFRDVPIALLNEHTDAKLLQELLAPMQQGETWGLISDAGLPCIADPGAQLVLLARKKGISIEAVPGPSSIFLALMLSGLSAQKFTFHGYLERDPIKLRQEITALEKESKQRKCTQLCIEAPYRSQTLLEILLEVLDDMTTLSISSRLTYPEEQTWTLLVKEWKKQALPDLHKKEAIFLFYAL